MVIRAAIEIGSGIIRLTVADVNPETEEVREILEHCATGVPFAYSAHSQNRLDEEIYLKARRVLADYKSIAQRHQVVKITGVATETFRKVSNGEDFIRSLSETLAIPLKIIDQDEEGEYGFKTVAWAVVGNIAETRLISIDSGNASTQLTTLDCNRQFKVYKVPFGHFTTWVVFQDVLSRRKVEELNRDISWEEIKALVNELKGALPEAPEWLKEEQKLLVRKCSYNGIMYQLFGQGNVRIKRIRHTLKSMVSDSGNEGAALDVALLYALMQKTGIKQVKFAPMASGNGYGLITSSRLFQEQ